MLHRIVLFFITCSLSAQQTSFAWKTYRFEDYKMSRKKITETCLDLREWYLQNHGYHSFLDGYDVFFKIITYNKIYLRLYYYPNSKNSMAFPVKCGEPLETAVALFNSQNEAIGEDLDPFIPIGPLQNIICEYAAQPRIKIVD